MYPHTGRSKAFRPIIPTITLVNPIFTEVQWSLLSRDYATQIVTPHKNLEYNINEIPAEKTNSFVLSVRYVEWV